MAEDQCTESSVAASSSPPNWWDLHATSSLASWTSPNPACWHQPNPNSNSSCDEDATSFTNASNHSGLTVESSRRLHAADPAHASSHEHHDHNFMAEAASDNHIWSQLLLGVGSNGELHNSQGVGENNILSSKSFSTGMYEPACDYLKQLENWELTNSPSFNGFSESLMDSKRLTKLSNMVGNWSIAPPNPEINRHFEPQLPCSISLSSSMDHHHYSPPLDLSHRGVNNGRNSMNSGLSPSYNHGIGTNYSDHLKLEDDDHWEMEGAAPLRRRSPFNGNSIVGDGNKCHYGIQNSPRNFADVISFSTRLGKPSLINNIHAPKLSSKALNLSDNCKKQALQTSSQTRINGGRGQGINQGKKKRISEDNSETVVKKTKQEYPSTAKVPKVKLADRITALQQIVSPFGKTDTASVLYEAIGYIKFLQEQVQLLSNPYMKITNTQKDPWGGMDRKEKGDARHDLRSRGLCLVPISCTPQVYRENTGSDYWTPAYRGCLYR